MTQRPPPTEEQVASVFRALAEGRSLERAHSTRQDTWRRLQIKRQYRARRSASSWFFELGWKVRLGAATAVTAVALMFVLWPAPTDLTYALRQQQGNTSGEGVATLDDGWVRTGSEPAALDFSDGSVLEMAAHTMLNVNVLGEHSAWTRVSKGKVTARVHHADKTNWSFFAGPYEVRVVGTTFDLNWDNAELSIAMHDGEVRVLGPDQARWVLRKGERLTIPGTGDNGEARTASVTPEPAAERPNDESPSGDSPSGDSPTAKSAPSASLPGWSGLLAKGRFADIVSDAKRMGVERAHGTLPAGELAAFAQAATYTGDASQAQATWLKIRSRFAGTPSAQRGAFFLARLEEQRGRHTDAASWLSAYLSEAPGGVYAAEAHGRQLVLARRLSGTNSPRSRALARDYLKRFPRGAYVETARATLGHR
jgi:ferric-dicitrate binding protein FerR (iron transport regulator)